MALTAQQHSNRMRGVGGSEVLAALGRDPRCSMLELYRRKTGESPAPDLSNDQRVHFGTLLEPVLRREIGRRLGVQVIQRHETLFHSDAPLVGHIDGWIRSERCGVEIKTADHHEAADYGEVGSDQVPVRHWLQCASYMALTGAQLWHLGVLIGGNDLRLYVVRRDSEIEHFILAGVREFWRRVEERRPPDPATVADCSLRWPRDLGGTPIAARPDVVTAVTRLHDLRRQLAEIEDEASACEFAIKSYMGEHAQLSDDDGRVLVTWRSAKASRRFDASAFAIDHPELFSTYQREQPGSRRFLLKP